MSWVRVGGTGNYRFPLAGGGHLELRLGSGMSWRSSVHGLGALDELEHDTGKPGLVDAQKVAMRRLAFRMELIASELTAGLVALGTGMV